MKKLIQYWKETGLVKDERILKAFEDVPREEFVTKEFIKEAYGDYPLPIYREQTISQPSTVMLMTDALEVKQSQKILEIGTGSGYQAAILAKLVGKNGRVYTTEIIPELIEFAKKNLKKIGIINVVVIYTDGSKGYAKAAPYDRIIVTAACPKIPQPLTKQLKEGGIIVAPVGGIFFGQKMIKGKKVNNRLITETLGDFTFVPLKGEYGFK